MKEQLPTPINELVILNLYLGSVTLILGIGFVALIIYRSGKYNWTKFILITALLTHFRVFIILMDMDELEFKN